MAYSFSKHLALFVRTILLESLGHGRMVMEAGGQMSHVTVVTRQYRLPSVVVVQGV